MQALEEQHLSRAQSGEQDEPTSDATSYGSDGSSSGGADMDIEVSPHGHPCHTEYYLPCTKATCPSMAFVDLCPPDVSKAKVQDMMFGNGCA